MIRKDVIFAVLTTFCLCALMFTVLPIRSGQPYDPWADINGDGTINMKDIAYVASQFNTAGDSTKNVNVTNWPTNWNEPQYETGKSETVVNMTWSEIGWNWNTTTDIINTGGYSKMSIFIDALDVSMPGIWLSHKFLTVSVQTLRWADVPVSNVSEWPWHSSQIEVVNDLNITASAKTDRGVLGSSAQAQLFNVKGPCCLVGLFPQWSENAPPADNPIGWITVQISWYLRND